MGIMGRAVFYSPVLHGLRHNVRGCKGKLPALVHDLLHLFIYILGKTLSHSAQVEYVSPKIASTFKTSLILSSIPPPRITAFSLNFHARSPAGIPHPLCMRFLTETDFPPSEKTKAAAVAITPRLPRIFCCPYHKVPAARVFQLILSQLFYTCIKKIKNMPQIRQYADSSPEKSVFPGSC